MRTTERIRFTQGIPWPVERKTAEWLAGDRSPEVRLRAGGFKRFRGYNGNISK